MSNTPLHLENLLSDIPDFRFRERRLPGKWSIHEQVCHLVEAQQVLIDRFELFESMENPLIRNYNPDGADEPDRYLHMNMDDALRRFPMIRQDMVEWLSSLDDSFWEKRGRHEAFEPYGTKILLMHCLNVDYAHLFSIEQLGFTKPGMEEGIMTLP